MYYLIKQVSTTIKAMALPRYGDILFSSFHTAFFFFFWGGGGANEMLIRDIELRKI